MVDAKVTQLIRTVAQHVSAAFDVTPCRHGHKMTTAWTVVMSFIPNRTVVLLISIIANPKKELDAKGERDTQKE